MAQGAVTVRGRHFRTEGELAEAIDELARMREDEVTHLRTEGREADADKRADAYDRELTELRGALRTVKERAARSSSSRSSSDYLDPAREADRRRARAGEHKQRAAAGRAAAAQRSRDRRELSSAAASGAGAVFESSGASSVTDLLLYIAGGTLAAIILYALLNERGHGPGAVQGIAKAGEGFLGRLMSPTDPLVFAGSARSSSSSSSSSAAKPAAPASPPSPHVAATVSGRNPGPN